MNTIGFMNEMNETAKVVEEVKKPETKIESKSIAKSDAVKNLDRAMAWMVGLLIVLGVAILFMCGMIAGMHVAISEFNDAGIEYTKMSGPNGDEEHYFVRTGWQVTPIAEFGTNRIFRITKNK